MLRLLLVPPGVRSMSVTSPTASNGIWALTWFGETNNIGTGNPFTVRQLFASAVGSGISAVAMFTGLSCEPNTEINPPGAMLALKSAALTTLDRTGGATAAE